MIIYKKKKHFLTKNRFLTNLFKGHLMYIKNRLIYDQRIYVKIMFRWKKKIRIIYICMRSIVRFIKIVLTY